MKYGKKGMGKSGKKGAMHGAKSDKFAMKNPAFKKLAHAGGYKCCGYDRKMSK